ncbi:MAG TPA: glycogen debranching N-terminal domain-containing protein [Gemmatimonadales bacterium]|nr:glycogen debranching N-terminal domain-containing protein [Gemmatimonadales bacterium]
MSGRSGLPTPTATEPRADPPLQPVSMAEAVGYGGIDCAHQTPTEDALVLKHDRHFLLVNAHGDIVPAGACSLGLYRDDTRVLSHYALRLAGGPPALLSAQIPCAYTAQIDLAVNDRIFGGDPWDPRNVIHLRRELLLADRLRERLTLVSYLRAPIEYTIELAIGCDFADIFEVRGWKREQRGRYFAPRPEGDRVVFSYEGRDGLLLESAIRFATPPTELSGSVARWRVHLEGDRRVELEWEVVAGEADRPATVASSTFDAQRSTLDVTYHDWRTRCTRWTTSLGAFDALLDRAVDDLRALHVEVDGDRVLSAGIPWYSTIFGRDAIIASLQTLPLRPSIARETLRYLARRQGEREDPYTEEQPGKILHELRRGEMARSGEIPHVPYYGSIDATPLWLVLLHETWRWTGDTALVRELLPAAERALAWIDRFGDLDGDGFVEYARTSAKGLVNQGWKDSGDGVPYPDGTLPAPPIALVEVQGYVHDAKVRSAELYQIAGRLDRAAALRREAAELRDRIRADFWDDDLGTFALALDGAKRPVRTATSNAGHLLWSRVPTVAQGERLRERFLQADFFSGWGVRTLSAAHPVFNPMSYHDGSVWPHDNALLVLGLSLYGHARAAVPVVRAVYEAGAGAAFQRLPELYCGLSRGTGARPVGYPVSCSPQAWASGALFMMLQALLGLYPDAPAGVLHVRDPVLPDFLDHLTLENLSVGGSRVALQFRRHGTRTLANLLGIDGTPLQVRIELS